MDSYANSITYCILGMFFFFQNDQQNNFKKKKNNDLFTICMLGNFIQVNFITYSSVFSVVLSDYKDSRYNRHNKGLFR